MSESPFTVKKQLIALLMVMLSCFYSTHAQVTDTLKPVNVKTNRKKISGDERINTYSPGQKVKTIDSLTLELYRYQSMASVLSQQVPVFVKSYGFNSLATLNFRGASAAQSQVYWNGIPLQNAATGIADVSMLQTTSFSKVNIVYGGSSALWGSGNVGGALILESESPYFSNTTSFHNALSFAGGSFGQVQFGIKSSVSMQRLYTNVSFATSSANNNFRYTDNGTTYQTDNSKVENFNGQVQLGYKANDKNTFAFTGWFQNYDRQIPKALFELKSVKYQQDKTIRLLGDWKRQGDKLSLYTKLAYLQDDMHYNDSVIYIDAKYSTHQVYGEAGVNYRISTHHKFMLFIPVQYVWMERQSLNDVVRQPRYAVALAYSLTAFHNKLHIALHGRGMYVSKKTSPMSGLNIAYAFTNWLSIRTNIQRSYRMPTLNDLYYYPGGDTSLKPEQGWSEDFGYVIKTNTNKRLVFFHDVSLFNRRIKDWIIWFGGAIWTPHNIAQVHSRGVETETSLQYSFGNFKLHAGLNTAYVLATTEISYIPGDGSIGKQIPYTPRYNGQANIGFSYKNVYFNYNHTYTGYRFITVDESSWLMPYNTGNIQLMYALKRGAYSIQFVAQCNNIWNEQYQVVSGRPMPGVNWLAGISLSR
ncbi:MAG: TonB-dependent receptor [Bacteroidetes bacterium]|nr:TonB-dependent receptor [Bacteroidota bacterium]